jgi:nucleoside-diphosphate-sugar epimerase
LSRVLVTGATGFTGKALCRRLVEEGRPVTAFVRPTSNTDELRALGVQCRIVDIKSRDDVFRNFKDFSHVYHIAAAYRTEHADHQEFQLVNVEATRNLLEAAHVNGVERFVHCSTGGVQGEIEDPPADENYRYQPNDHYQESKLAGELLAREYFANGVPGAVIRPIGIHGPGDTRFLKLFRAIDRGRFVMLGDGEKFYHMTYIDDLIDGFLLAGSKEEARGEVFNIAGERYGTLNELVALVARVIGRKPPKLHIPLYPVYLASVACDSVCRTIGVSPPIYPRRLQFFQYHRAFSIEKARQKLGYQPKVSLEDGLGRTAAWYREQGLV